MPSAGAVVTVTVNIILVFQVCLGSDDLEHWNKVIILTKFSSLAALEVVNLTTSSAAIDENFIKVKTFQFQCLRAQSGRHFTKYPTRPGGFWWRPESWYVWVACGDYVWFRSLRPGSQVSLPLLLRWDSSGRLAFPVCWKGFPFIMSHTQRSSRMITYWFRSCPFVCPTIGPLTWPFQRIT